MALYNLCMSYFCNVTVIYNDTPLINENTPFYMFLKMIVIALAVTKF